MWASYQRCHGEAPRRGAKKRPKPRNRGAAETAKKASPPDPRSDLSTRDGVGVRSPFALAIFGVALAVRCMWQIRKSPFFSLLMGDSRGYDEWARRIAGGDWVGNEVFYRAPLYPYLLGLIYTVAGRHLLLVRLVQAVIGSASCALLALAAARLFSKRACPEHGRRTGIAAGLMLALYAPAIFFDGLLQKSVLDVFFVCLALWLVSRSEETAEIAKAAEKGPFQLPSLLVVNGRPGADRENTRLHSSDLAWIS